MDLIYSRRLTKNTLILTIGFIILIHDFIYIRTKLAFELFMRSEDSR